MTVRALSWILTSVSLAALAQVSFKIGMSFHNVRVALEEYSNSRTVMSFATNPTSALRPWHPALAERARQNRTVTGLSFCRTRHRVN
jgi:hypothetical protein